MQSNTPTSGTEPSISNGATAADDADNYKSHAACASGVQDSTGVGQSSTHINVKEHIRFFETKTDDGRREIKEQRLRDGMKTKNKTVEERIQNLKFSQLHLLKESQFPSEMKRTFKDMTISIDTRNCVIVVNGWPNDIRNLKIKMSEQLNSMLTLKWDTNEAISSLLKTKEVQQYFVKIFQNHKITVVWEFEKYGIAISSLSRHELKTAWDIMQREVMSIPVQASEEAKDTLSGKVWTRFKEDLLKEQQNMLRIDDYHDGGICITTLAENANYILDNVYNFIEFNTVIGGSIQLERGVVRYMHAYMKDQIKKIEQDRADAKVSIKWETSAIQVWGTTGGFHDAVRDVNALVESVTISQLKIDIPWMANLFTEKEGEEKLRFYEAKYSCVIETEIPMIVNEAVDDVHSAFGESKPQIDRLKDGDLIPRTSADTTQLQSSQNNQIVSKDELKISLKTSVIADEQVDVIVNTTGKELDLNVGAVSSSLNAAAGPGMQLECLQNVPPGGYQEGQVVVTNGHNLSCQMVCHGSCPAWDKGAGNSEKVLRQYITNCLLQADSRGFSSIAFPAIGTGNLNFPVAVVAVAMFDEVYKFGEAHQQTTLKDVRFILYDKDKPTVQGFVDQLKKQSDSAAGTACLNIYADSTATVERLERDIGSYCQSQGRAETIAGEWGDMITKLTHDEIELMSSIVEDVSVHLRIDPNRKQIEIEGICEEVFKTKEKILVILQKKKDNIQTIKHAEALFEEISWEYEDGGEYKRYEAMVNATMEGAHKRHQKLVTCHCNSGQCTIDLSKMEMTCGSAVLKVRRKDLRRLGVDDFPECWAKMSADEDLKLVTLSPDHQEHKDVLSSFQKTAKEQTVLKIERIQNPSLYQKYLTDKARMEKANIPGTQNEKTLWHGTADKPLNQINRRGFDRGFHGANGTRFGKGVYFAVNASYSVGYAKANTSKHRHIYRCQVLTGEFVKGNKSLIVPPARDPNDASILYDSVVDDVDNPQMYVVFQDCQAYPEYLITFD